MKKRALSWTLSAALMVTTLVGAGGTMKAHAQDGTIRINCGSAADYTDTLGNVWLADIPYDAAAGWGYTGDTGVDLPPNAGAEGTDASGYEVVNSDEDALYKIQRNCTTFAENYAQDPTLQPPKVGYRFDLPDGRYKVTLKFCELYEGTPAFHHWEGIGTNPAGRRLVNIYLEDALYVKNQDLFAERGSGDPIAPMTDYAANDKSFVVAVADGQLNILLRAVANKAAIAGIEISATDEPLSVPLDTTAPVISLDQTGGTVEQSQYLLTGTVSEPCTLTLNGVAVPVGEDLHFSASVSLQQGENILSLTAVDAVGNTGTASVVVTCSAPALQFAFDKPVILEGEEFKVTLKASNVTGLKGFHLNFHYDEAAFTLVEVKPSVEFGDGAYFEKVEDNGKIELLGALTGDKSFSGDVGLAEVTLRSHIGTAAGSLLKIAAGAEISIGDNRLYTFAADITGDSPVVDPDIVGGHDGVLVNDAAAVAGSYMARIGDPAYNPAYDMNKNGVIDLDDIIFIVNYMLDRT